VVRGSGLTGAATSWLRTGAGDKIASTRGFLAGCSTDGTGSETDGSSGCRFGVKSASAARRALVILSRSSPRRWCCCWRWLSKGRPDCLATRDIEVEFVKFGKSLPHFAGWPFRVNVAKPEIIENLLYALDSDNFIADLALPRRRFN